MPKTNKKIKSAELHKDRNTQAFLSKFLGGEINELEPVYDPEQGYRYPIVESIIGDAASVNDFLNGLHKAGMLKRRLYDKIIYCP
ncbi:hypothetical protein KAW04_00245, partial [Candidatus Bathyarchaeota archaeon]|nr:hypothetical protein [Candidatus Bathyarchaeota archaeon]